ncbi:unnamed protein product [Chironomus riparius]|uniref:Uncharacterized protein n=1 Tax=Chironomus riparius TaxID=315576 RepID=A0A9N9S6V3_9DIPT|nr:unnamed protein product [Chironomus riparius]
MRFQLTILFTSVIFAATAYINDDKNYWETEDEPVASTGASSEDDLKPCKMSENEVYYNVFPNIYVRVTCEKISKFSIISITFGTLVLLLSLKVTYDINVRPNQF